MTVLKISDMKTHPEMFKKWGLKKELVIGAKKYYLYDFHPDKSVALKLAREVKDDGASSAKLVYRKKAYFEEYRGPGKHQGYFSSVWAVYFR